MASDFYNGKTVMVTGHSGFKGTWLSSLLLKLGAKVVGYSLEPPTDPNLYSIVNLDDKISSINGDVRNYHALQSTIEKYRPEIIIHMAAQPLVSIGYSNPIETYSTNVMGTVNLLEAASKSPSVQSIINVTTDKVYQNNEWVWGYRENEPLNGYDPYSNSKSCSELVTASYRNSFLKDKIPVSTARAGNVIGGGDFTNPRIIPDCFRAVQNKKPLTLRNPESIRPYQHVLEPICAYLMIAEKQFFDHSVSGSYNVGPNEDGCVNNEQLIQLFAKHWGDGFEYTIRKNSNEPHEANFLKLDCSKIKTTFNWKPIWTIDEAISKTVNWMKAYLQENSNYEMNLEIDEYLETLGIWEYE